MTARILVAGIGNIFHGDDAFGCEVARRLAARPLPAGVYVRDFGIRSFDLAFAILDGYDATILVDATSQGGTPGTLYLIRPEMEALAQIGPGAMGGHTMNPVKVLQLVKRYGGAPERLFLVGCEPASLESHDGQFTLTPPVEAAVEGAIERIEALIETLQDELVETTSQGREPHGSD